MIPKLREIEALENLPDEALPPDQDRSLLHLRKWRLIHDYVHDRPFTTDPRLARGEQWRRAVDYARDIGEIELLDWVLLQVEIASHLERGIRDLRPRKDGPCHELILEYVANRKRKAHAVRRWLKAAGESA